MFDLEKNEYTDRPPIVINEQDAKERLEMLRLEQEKQERLLQEPRPYSQAKKNM